MTDPRGVFDRARASDLNGDEPVSIDDPAYFAALEAEATTLDSRPDGWTVVDLMPAWRGQRVKPTTTVLERSDGIHLLPPGINYLFGDSGDGKSWIGEIAAAQLIKAAADVVWVTYEDVNEDEIVERMKLLGATEADVVHLHVVIATEALTSGVHWLGHLCRQTNAALLVIDSIGEAFAVEGVDEDRDAEVGPWFRRTLRRLIDICADPEGDDETIANVRLAVWPIDHATKAKDNPYYPSGSKRKRAAVTGVMMLLNVRQPLARERVGRIQLVAAKDRVGRFRRGEITAEIVIDATTTPYTFTIDAPADGTALISGRKRRADERVLQVLEESNVALDTTMIHRLVNDHDTRLPGEGELTLGTVKNTMTQLARKPTITRHTATSGPGGKGVHVTYTLNPPPRP